MEADLKNENLLLIVKRRGRSSYGILMKNDKVKKKLLNAWMIHSL